MELQIGLVFIQHDVLGSLLLMWKTACQASVEPLKHDTHLREYMSYIVQYIKWNLHKQDYTLLFFICLVFPFILWMGVIKGAKY